MAFPRNDSKIWDMIDRLKFREDIIEIHFLDASKSRGVKRIDNKVVATYKKLIGLFMCVEPDQLYGQPHLLMEDLTEGTLDRPTIYSVLVASIVKVKRINNNTKKTVGDIGYPYLAGNKVKIAHKNDGIGVEIDGY